MYEEEINHLARLFQSLPLFMERWEGLSMDLFTNMATTYGKDCILMFIYQLTIFFHSFTVHFHHIAPRERKYLCGFHGPFGTTFSDGDDHFMEDFGQDVFFLDHIQPTPNILYYFQDFEKLMATSKWLDGHLSHYVLKQQKEEQRWIQLKDYYHHPTCYITYSPFLFWVPYGKDTLFTICGMDWARVILGTKQWGHESPSAFWLLNDYIIATKD